MEDPANTIATGRNADGTFKPGVSGNPSGRPKNTMKDYISRKFQEMSDEEKALWLIENKVTGIDQWKMGEGNPSNNTDVTSGGQPIEAIIGMHITKDNGDTIQNQEPKAA